jgi:hypothetical protein
LAWSKERSKLEGWKHKREVWKLEYTGARVAQFSGMTTAPMNRMARPEVMRELDKKEIPE